MGSLDNKFYISQHLFTAMPRELSWHPPARPTPGHPTVLSTPVSYRRRCALQLCPHELPCQFCDDLLTRLAHLFVFFKLCCQFCDDLLTRQVRRFDFFKLRSQSFDDLLTRLVCLFDFVDLRLGEHHQNILLACVFHEIEGRKLSC